MDWIAIFCYLSWIHFSTSYGQQPQELEHEYRIHEELPKGTQIGNIIEDILLYKAQPFVSRKAQTNVQSHKQTGTDFFEFKILNFGQPGVNTVEVTKDGRLIVIKRIDREQLCPASTQVDVLSMDNVYNMQYTSQHKPHTSASFMSTSTYCQVVLKLSITIKGSLEAFDVIKETQLDGLQILLNIRLLVDDINDNAPYWPGYLKRFQVTFRDGDPVGERRTLPPAIDVDAGLNGQLSYELVSTAHSDEISSTFSLIDHAVDGIYLCATRQIDREEQEAYQYILKAIDRSNSNIDPMLSKEKRFTSTLVIDVHIEDINDNTPLFVQPIFTPSAPIPETAPVGKTILILNATDADAGINGAFHFGFSREHAWLPAEVYAKQYFEVRSNGQIVVRRPLNVDRDRNFLEAFNHRHISADEGISSSQVGFVSSSLSRSTTVKFRFHVLVEDEAVRPYSRSSEAAVVITVTDENDEAPIIEVREVQGASERKPSSQPTSFNYLSVSENEPIGTVVAIIHAYDPDFEGTDHVECRLKTSNFTLIQTSNPSNSLSLAPGGVTYHLQTTVELDRESTPIQLVPISCMDMAGHLTERNLSAYISDQNDNPPKFSQDTFHMEVWENMPPGTQLQRMESARGSVLESQSNLMNHPSYLSAVDPDTGGNAEVFFQLLENGANATSFKIDSKTGVISTTLLFDRELSEHYILQALAIDRGVPSLTSTSTVKVTILDVNDNAPQFGSNEYTFHVMENQPRATQVGQVTATDSDSDFYGPIHYMLREEPNAANFRIDKTSGILRCRQSLDREKQARYVFTVLAKDASVLQSTGKSISSEQLTGTCTVTVLVDDENDNWPVFITPNATANTLAIAVDETLGHKLAYIQATDADDGENALITYTIRSGNTNGLFGLDSTTGLLYLSGLPRGASTFKDDSPNRNVTVNLVGDPEKDVSTALVSPSFHMLTLEACDHGKQPKQKCTLFNNLKILIKNRRDGEMSAVDGDNEMLSDSGLRRREKALQGRKNEPTTLRSSGQVLGAHSSPMAYGVELKKSTAGRFSINEIIIICLSVLFIAVLAATILLVCLIRRRSLGYFSREKVLAEEDGDGHESEWSAKNLGNQLSYIEVQSPTHMQHSSETSEPSLKNQIEDSINECRTEQRNHEASFENELDGVTGFHGFQPNCLTSSAYQLPPRTVDTLRRWPLISSTTSDGGAPNFQHTGSSANQITTTLHPLHNRISFRPDEYQTLDYLGLVTTAIPNRYVPVYRVPPRTLLSPVALHSRGHFSGTPMQSLGQRQTGNIGLTHMNPLADIGTTQEADLQISHKHSRSQPQAMNIRYNTYSQLCPTVTTFDDMPRLKTTGYTSRPLKTSTYRSMTNSVQNMNGIHYGGGSKKYQLQSHTYYDIRQPDSGDYSGHLPKSKSQHVEFNGGKFENRTCSESKPKTEVKRRMDFSETDSGVVDEQNSRTSEQPRLDINPNDQNDLPERHTTKIQDNPGNEQLNESARKKLDGARYVSAAYGEASFV